MNILVPVSPRRISSGASSPSSLLYTAKTLERSGKRLSQRLGKRAKQWQRAGQASSHWIEGEVRGSIFIRLTKLFITWPGTHFTTSGRLVYPQDRRAGVLGNVHQYLSHDQDFRFRSTALDVSTACGHHMDMCSRLHISIILFFTSLSLAPYLPLTSTLCEYLMAKSDTIPERSLINSSASC